MPWNAIPINTKHATIAPIKVGYTDERSSSQSHETAAAMTATVVASHPIHLKTGTYEMDAASGISGAHSARTRLASVRISSRPETMSVDLTIPNSLRLHSPSGGALGKQQREYHCVSRDWQGI